MESTTGTTADGSVPPSPAPPDGPPLGRRLAVLAVALATIAFLWFATSVQLAYFAIAPGSVVDTSLLITVDEAHAHPPEGQILLTTVSLGRVTLLEAIQGWLDPGVDVVQRRLIVGDSDIDDEELRRANLELMNESKQKAIAVALSALGYRTVTGAGAEIVLVEPETPAAGLVEVGDTIVAVDGEPVALDLDAIREIGSRPPGATVTVGIEGRDGGQRDVTVTLAARPDDPARAYLGVALTTRDLAFDFPIDIELRSEQIGGPSAGLAYTLQVIDMLTEGELTGGARVAVTGTIELDGTVGAVGGIAQKTIAVRRAGAALFLVPSAEVETARRFAGEQLRVEAVDSLDQALAALADLGGNGLALPVVEPQGAS